MSNVEINVPDNLESIPEETRMELALEAYQDSQARTNIPDKQKLSLRKTATLFNVPHSTLTDRSHGMRTRREAHENEQNLTFAQEELLVEWAQSLGRRGVPLTPTSLAEYATHICGFEVGLSWPWRFLERHPELKIRWSQSMEACRAKAVNHNNVQGFYDIYEEIIKTYDIQPGNIYNCDEKGIQLGVGKHVNAIIDREQKNVYNVEDGNREMVTVIETVCADGSALHPSIIFPAKRTNAAWGRNNTCNASISSSPNGWTDQELGAIWLERDFHPATARRNESNGYRLLILDGHNSHCTYRFCKFAEAKHIIVICLPSHTTHVLQPCDVAVFGPLAACWKSQVNLSMYNGITINKSNLIEHYSTARERALKETTIKVAFLKTGIYPFDRTAIPASMYEPSLNTTTQSAQPIPNTFPTDLMAVFESATNISAMSIKSTATTLTLLPSAESTPSPSFSGSVPSGVPTPNLTHVTDQDLDILDISSEDESEGCEDGEERGDEPEIISYPTTVTPAQMPSTESTDCNRSEVDHEALQNLDGSSINTAGSNCTLDRSASPLKSFSFPMPNILGRGATYEELQNQNSLLVGLLRATCRQIQKDFAHKQLMELENEKL